MGFDWDEAKDLEVQEKHGVSFQEIRRLIERGGLLKVVLNRSSQYSGQKALLVRKGNAVYMVPFERRGETRWLITVFYSAYYTKKYSR